MYEGKQAMVQAYGGSMAGGLSSVGAEAARRPELASHMDKLGAAVSYAEDSLNELCKQLDGKAVRSAGPETAPTGVNQIMPAPPQTYYAQQACELAARSGRIGERIQDLLRRLEI